MTKTVEELVALEMKSPTDYEESLGLKTTLKEEKNVKKARMRSGKISETGLMTIFIENT